MNPKFLCGTTCTKGPNCEMLACENTTPCHNLHLEEKPTIGKSACEVYATTLNELLDKK